MQEFRTQSSAFDDLEDLKSKSSGFETPAVNSLEFKDLESKSLGCINFEFGNLKFGNSRIR